MLVLTRKNKEKIQIGPEITVTILRIKGRSVQIGIEAPAGVTVLRTELIDRSERLSSGEAEEAGQAAYPCESDADSAVAGDESDADLQKFLVGI